MIKTFAGIFTGGGGADIGLMSAGLRHLWGIEYDAKIAAVANDNIGGVMTADILEVDPCQLDKPDWLHMSPPCPNFSVAKSGGEETEHDIALANKCADFVTALRPKVVSLENVRAYEKSQSWSIIYNRLVGSGYTVQWSIVNMADFGVPQKRIRMIAVAILGSYGLFMPPPATHCKGGRGGLWGLEKWVSWDEVIEGTTEDIAELPAGKIRARHDGADCGDMVTNKMKFDGWLWKPGKPSGTIAATVGNSSYIIVGAMQQLTPRSFAKLQSFPDTYRLPSSKALACRIIGNAVPPLFMQKLATFICGII